MGGGGGRIGQGGLILVELVVVAAVLAVGLLGLVALQVATVRAAAACSVRLTAINLADSLLEERRCLGQAGSGPGPWAFDREGRPVPGSGFFTAELSSLAFSQPTGLDAADAGAQPGSVRVRVTWPESAQGRRGRFDLIAWLGP